jgi:hypothetical protein
VLHRALIFSRQKTHVTLFCFYNTQTPSRSLKRVRLHAQSNVLGRENSFHLCDHRRPIRRVGRFCSHEHLTHKAFIRPHVTQSRADAVVRGKIPVQLETVPSITSPEANIDQEARVGRQFAAPFLRATALGWPPRPPEPQLHSTRKWTGL